MTLLRIRQASALDGFRIRLVLSDGSVIERDLTALLQGPAFEAVRRDRAEFCAVSVEAGALAWPGGADLCADMVIWNGPAPQDGATPAVIAVLAEPVRAR